MIGRTFHLLVRADTIKNAHEQVAVDYCLKHTDQKGRRDLETFVLLDALYADADYRDMSIAIFGQGTADETDIIGCPAAASCLGNDDSRFVQVVFTGSKGGHDLSHNDEGRVAGVIVYVFQPCIHCLFAHLRQHIHVVAAMAEYRRQKVEMNRRHLRYQDRIILAHFFGKFHLFNVCRNDLRFDILFVPDAHGGDQGTDADSCCSQVVDLVDLQYRVDSSGIGKNVVDRVGGDGVQSASKRVQLNHFKLFIFLSIVGGAVQTGMIHPLVRYDKRPFHIAQMTDGILAQHGDAIGVNELRNTMVDLRVDVIRASAEDDAHLAGFRQVSKGFLTFGADILTYLRSLLVGGIHGFGDFFLRHVIMLAQLFKKTDF